MKHQEVINKIITPGEEIKHQFSIGLGHLAFNFSMWIILCFFLVWFYLKTNPWLPIIVLSGAAFYYIFYLPRAHIYVFTDRRLLIYRGWLSTSLVTIDYNRITNTKVIEDIFDKIITQTGSLMVSTAGALNGGVRIDNIDSPYQLKQKLDELVQQHCQKNNKTELRDD